MINGLVNTGNREMNCPSTDTNDKDRSKRQSFAAVFVVRLWGTLRREEA